MSKFRCFPNKFVTTPYSIFNDISLDVKRPCFHRRQVERERERERERHRETQREKEREKEYRRIIRVERHWQEQKRT